MFLYYRFASVNPKNEAIIQEGIQLCNLAIQANIMKSHAYFALAFILINRKKNTENIEVLNTLVQTNERYPNACFNLARALDREGQTDRAAELYRRALFINPGHAGACQTLESSYMIKTG